MTYPPPCSVFEMRGVLRPRKPRPPHRHHRRRGSTALRFSLARLFVVTDRPVCGSV